MFQTSIKIIRTNNGREYFSNNLSHYLAEHGIFHQNSCLYAPQQNGVAERKNRHLLEVARAMMITMNVPHSYWGEAVLIAAYLINRLPSKALQFQTHLSILCTIYPTISTILSIAPKVFGCIVYVYNNALSRTKLDPKVTKCIFVGYSPLKRVSNAIVLPVTNFWFPPM